MCHKRMTSPGLGTLFEVVPGVSAFRSSLILLDQSPQIRADGSQTQTHPGDKTLEEDAVVEGCVARGYLCLRRLGWQSKRDEM
jgi:hypothetical protein